MPLLYLSVYPTSDARPRIACIAHQPLGGASPLYVDKADSPAGEGGLLRGFVGHTHFWKRTWQATPVGVEVEPQLRLLHDRSVAHGLVGFGEDHWGFKRPIDLYPIMAVLNADAPPVPEGPDGKPLFTGPDMFFGARLGSFTRTRLNGASVADLLKNGQVEAAEKAVRDEHAAFMRLWGPLAAEAPKWWRGTLREKVQA